MKVTPSCAMLCLFLLTLSSDFTTVAHGCPFCGPPALTLSESIDEKTAVVLVQWVEGTKPEKKSAGNTTFKIVEILKAPPKKLEKGQKITLFGYRAAQMGDLYVLFGSRTPNIEWGEPLEVSETSWNYIKQSPPLEADPKVRLTYYLQFLEFPDKLIAGDAFQIFGNAPYEDISEIADKLPRDRLRKWLVDPNTEVARLGLYGLLLGLCGTEEDAKTMENIILDTKDELRLGVNGVIAGYLQLKGEPALDLIEKTKLKPKYQTDAKGNFVLNSRGEKKKFPFSETYAAVQALRFYWTYGNGKISKDRLRKAMRELLAREELGDLVIADLARWKDWSVQDKLMTLYEDEDYSLPSTKRAIVRYLIASMKDVSKEEGAELPKHAVNAKTYIELLRKKDPDIVEQAERFFLYN